MSVVKISSILLVILSIIVYLLMLFYHPVLNVGIVGVDGINDSYLKLAKEGFDWYYNDSFNAIMLEESFNDSKIKVKEEYYLNGDFFIQNQTSDLIDKHNLDFLLIVTDKKIKDWDGSNLGVWGQADTESSSCLATVYYFQGGSDVANDRIRSIAVHEVLHLVGFVHNPFHRGGIMQYVAKQGSFELSHHFKFQYPIRLSLIRYFRGLPFLVTKLLMDFLMIILIMPFFLISQDIYNHFLNIKNHKIPCTILNLFFVTMVLIAFNYSAFIVLFAFYVQFGITKEFYNLRNEFIRLMSKLRVNFIKE